MLPVLKEGSSPLSVFRMKLNVAGISPVMTLAYPTWRGHHGVLPKLYRQNGLIPYCSGLKLKSRHSHLSGLLTDRKSSPNRQPRKVPCTLSCADAARAELTE